MKAKTILRWCAVPFAASLGAFISYFLISLWIKGNIYGFQIYNGEQIGSITQILLAIAAQAIFGGAFVYCGTIVAPANRRICAVVLSTVISLISIISLVTFIVIYGFTFMQLVHCAATAIGAIGAAKFLWDDATVEAAI